MLLRPRTHVTAPRRAVGLRKPRGALRPRNLRNLRKSRGAALTSLVLLACQPLGVGTGLAKATGAGATAAATAEPPSEVPLSSVERAALAAGQRVERPMVFLRAGQRYLGGVSYNLIDASAAQVFYKLNELDALAHVLGSTRRLEVVERSETRVRVELEQGNSLVSTSYTVVFEFEPPTDDSGSRLVLYWLDPSRPHGIEDVWGFFRLTPWPGGRTLVSVGTALNVGPGLIQSLFGSRLQASILRAPKRVREAVNGATRRQRARSRGGGVPSLRL